MGRRTSLFVALLLLSCKPESDIITDSDAADLPLSAGVIVVESTFEGDGYVEAISPGNHEITANYGTAFDDDPHLRRLVDPRDSEEHIYIVGSSQGTLTEINRKGERLAAYPVVDPGAPAGSADPYDVAIASDGALWVTRYLQPTLLVLEPNGAVRRTIDLSSFAPANGSSTHAPGMSAIAILGPTAYVALQRLDANKDPTNASVVVAIDTTTYAVTPFVTLPIADPFERFGAITQNPLTLWISCIGGPISKVPVPGGLVAIDVAAASTRIVLDGAIGGYFVTGFSIVDDDTGYATLASLSSSDNPTSLVKFDPSKGTLGPTWFSTDTYRLWDVVFVGGKLVVPDHSLDSPCLDVFDATDGAYLSCVPMHLPPVQLLVVSDES